MHDSTKAESWRLFVVSLLILLLGSMSGHWALALLLGLGGYILWQLYQMYKLENWLQSPGKLPADRLHGIWLYMANKMAQTLKRDRKRKKDLSRLVQRFHRAMEAMPDAVVVMEKNFVIQWHNQAARQLLGLPPVKKASAKRMDKLNKAQHLGVYLKKGDFSAPLEMRSPVDSLIELEIRIVKFGKGQLLLAAHDVTEAKRVQAVRRDFIANVSHELRTPLTVVSGYMELLESEELPEHALQAVIASRRQAERMQRIVTDLLMLSRLELGEEIALDAETVDVAQLLQGLVEDARRLSGDKQHEFSLEADESLQLMGSEAELSSAFGNLLFNAVIHTPAQTPIYVYWRKSLEGASLVVEDQGPGISPEHLQRLTERFYRVDKGRSRKLGGTGLGLSIVKHVLHRHAASIKIDSKPGVRTRFTCEFPAERLVVR